jgi:hypothetical protein
MQSGDNEAEEEEKKKGKFVRLKKVEARLCWTPP